MGSLADLASPHLLVPIAFANAVVIIGIYFAFAALAWGVADAAMVQPRDLFSFATCSGECRRWRVAHLSDIHVVGERYGFRVESGRSGPQGNEQLARAMAKLDAIHATNPLDLVLITGDITDAGRSAEWAEFFGALAQYPRFNQSRSLPPRQPRLECGRPCKPSASRSSDESQETIAPGPHDFCASRPSRVPMFASSTERRGAWNRPLEKALEPHKAKMMAFARWGSISLPRFLSRSCGRSCSRWSSHRIQGMG